MASKNPESKTARRLAEQKERWPNGVWAGYGSREAFFRALEGWEPYGAKRKVRTEFTTKASKNRNR